jgi:hypothetical protein
MKVGTRPVSFSAVSSEPRMVSGSWEVFSKPLMNKCVQAPGPLRSQALILSLILVAFLSPCPLHLTCPFPHHDHPDPTANLRV